MNPPERARQTRGPGEEGPSKMPPSFDFFPGWPSRRNAFPLRHHDPTIIELAALLTGIKPVIYASYDDSNRQYLMDMCQVFNLMHLLPGRPQSNLPARGQAIFLGRSMRALQKAARAWRRNSIAVDWGLSLGYPRCCVRFYSLRGAPWSKDRIMEIIPRIRRNTKGSGPYGYALNNIFNFFSRLRAPVSADYQRLIEANVRDRLNFGALSVIPWHPCSYSCPESLRRAAVILRFLHRHVPGLVPSLKYFLQRPVLYLSSLEFALFDGEVDSNGDLRYGGMIQPPHTLLAPKLRRNIPKGDRLRAVEGVLTIYKDGRALARLREPRAILLDFTGNIE